MGGDGGVVATNRRYMRGAGTADHTGDYNRDNHESKEHNALEAMTTCALTKLPLNSSNPIVACAFGRLYQKEAAVEALLTKKAASGRSSSSTLGDHIRKLSDLYSVRFHMDAGVEKKGMVNHWTCPITGKALQGIIPAILLVPGKADTPNVLSESALDQLPKEELELEYGPITQTIRLAPPPELLKQIQQEEMERRSSQKKDKKSKKKRKQEAGESSNGEKKNSRPKTQPTATASKHTIGAAAKSRVDSAIQSNQVLSSLFTTTNPSKKSDKERKDGLFAR